MTRLPPSAGRSAGTGAAGSVGRLLGLGRLGLGLLELGQAPLAARLAAGDVDLLLELVRGRASGTVVVEQLVVLELGPADGELRGGELGVRGAVPERTGLVVEVLVLRRQAVDLLAGGAGAAVARAFAVAGHAGALQVSESRGDPCGTCTNGSTCAG